MTRVLAQDLRAAVLQAAVSGLLSSKQENDSNSEDLISRIKEIKEGLVLSKAIKKEAIIEPIDESSVQLDLPEHWRIARFVDLFNIRSALRIHESDWKKEGVPFLRGRELVKLSKTGILDSEVFITEDFYNSLKSKGGVPQKDDILITAVGTLGRVYIVTGEEGLFYYKDAYILCLENYGMNPKYVKIVLEAPFSQNVIYDDSSKGTTVAQLTIKKMKSMVLPVPSIEEQARIVVRVEELMTKIDEYEKLERQLAELKQKFPEEMKVAILQAAMQGKLTEQSENDTDIDELLKNVKCIKKQLIKEKKTKKEKPIKVISIEEMPFDIPNNWRWIKAGELVSVISGTSYNKGEIQCDGIRIIRGGNLKEFQLVANDDDVFLDDSFRQEDKIVKRGDVVVVASTGSITGIGRPAFCDNEPIDDMQIGAFLRIVRPATNDLFPYLKTIFKSNYYRAWISSSVAGIGIRNLKESHITEMLIPLPPLEEQQRIVEKLDSLLPLCDELAELA